MSHHGNDPKNIAQVAKINTYCTAVRQVPGKAAGDARRRRPLLDHSLIFYGGGMGNPNQHASDPLPMVAVGGGVGRDTGMSNSRRARRLATCG